MDDFDNTIAGAGALVLGAQTGGEIEVGGDKDWFGVALEAGNSYRVKIQGADTQNGTLADPVLGGIYGSTGLLLFNTSNDDGGYELDSELVFTPATTGTYYIEATSFGGETGTYGVTVAEIPAVPGSVFSVVAFNTVQFETDAGVTFYDFTVSRTGDVSSAASIDWDVNPIIGGDTVNGADFVGAALPGDTLNFAAGQTSQVVTVSVAGDTDVEPNETFSFDLSNPSTGSSINTASKLGTILDEDTLGTGSTYLSLLLSTFAYEGQAGFTPFQFQVFRGGDTSIAATANWAVEPVPGIDTVDGDDFQGGVLPTGMISFDPGEVTKAITVFVAGDSAIEGNETFSVVLRDPGADTEITTSGSKLFSSIFDDDEDDFGITPGDAGNLTLGSSLYGTVNQVNDLDWVGVELQAGNRYVVDLQGFDTFQGTLSNPLIEGIYNSASELQPDSSDDNSGSGFNSRLYFTPDADGTYYVSATGAGDTSGSYRLQVSLDTNNLPTGFVSIAGTPEQGETLTASSTILDDDGVGQVSYRWLADLAFIDGATSDTLMLTQDQVGKKIYVVASYVDGASNFEQLASPETAAVANVNDDPTGSVTITGDAEVGSILTATNNLADPDGIGTLTFQWHADDDPIPGAIGDSYAPDASVVGKMISVVVSYTDNFGTDEAVESVKTAAVQFGDQLIQGTAGDDSLTGADGNDTLIGLDGRDTLQGLAGDDDIQGGDDIDTARFQNELLDYTIVNSAGVLTVTGPASDGEDTVTGVERLDFIDICLAFDLDGNAGSTAKLLGVLTGEVDPVFMGIGLDIFDNAGLSFEQIMTLGLDVVLGTERTNADVVNLIYTNLLGQAPSAGELNALTAEFLDSGAYTQVGLAVLAADHPFNTELIGLTGLITNGVEYVPVV